MFILRLNHGGKIEKNPKSNYWQVTAKLVLGKR